MATSASKPAKGAADAGAAEAAPGGKKSKKVLIFGVIGAVILAGGGFAAAQLLAGGTHGKEGKAEAKAEHVKPPVFVQMEQFTVNLQAEDGGDQFLQTAFTLQADDEAQVEDMKVYMPLVRSRLLTLLSSKHASEISTPEGKKKLAEEIIAAVNQPYAKGLPAKHVTDVFFTSFVIQ